MTKKIKNAVIIITALAFIVAGSTSSSRSKIARNNEESTISVESTGIYSQKFLSGITEQQKVMHHEGQQEKTTEDSSIVTTSTRTSMMESTTLTQLRITPSPAPMHTLGSWNVTAMAETTETTATTTATALTTTATILQTMVETAEETKTEYEVSTTTAQQTEVTTQQEQQEQLETEDDQNQDWITLDEVQISLDMDISQPTGLSKEDFVKLINNLPYDKKGYFKRNAETIWSMCQEKGVNEIAACGIIAQESGWGKCHGWGKNNYFGISGGSYSTEEAGVRAFITLLGDKYLHKGGKFYKGKTLHAVGLTYCDGTKWPKAVYGCMKMILK